MNQIDGCLLVASLFARRILLARRVKLANVVILHAGMITNWQALAAQQQQQQQGVAMVMVLN